MKIQSTKERKVIVEEVTSFGDMSVIRRISRFLKKILFLWSGCIFNHLWTVWVFCIEVKCVLHISVAWAAFTTHIYTWDFLHLASVPLFKKERKVERGSRWENELLCSSLFVEIYSLFSLSLSLFSRHSSIYSFMNPLSLRSFFSFSNICLTNPEQRKNSAYNYLKACLCVRIDKNYIYI